MDRIVCSRTVLCFPDIIILLFVVSVILLVKPELLALGGLINITSIPDWINKASFIYCVFAVSFFVYKLVAYAYKLNSAKVKAVNYEIELQKDLDVSILNRYLDELVYLFQETDYRIVVLEDLDRFERTSIFTKLRELNLLLNQAKDINRRIVFIYALKDEVFEDYHERTKFFDLIISVLPVVNSSNSAAMFMQKLKSEIRTSKDEKGLDKDVVMDLAPFIDDMRSIKSIVTDYRLFKDFLHEGIQMNNLLALLVYKTKYPADYEDLYEGKGKIASVVSNKKRLIDNEEKAIQNEIKNIEEQIKGVEHDYLQSVEELNAIVVAAFFKCIPNGSQWGINNSTTDYATLFSDESVESILNGNGGIGYQNRYNYGLQYNNISASTIQSNLPANFDYPKRKSRLSSDKKNQIDALKIKHKHLQDQLTHLYKKTIKEICTENKKVLDILDECKENPLLKLLFAKGYIDENYQFYITIPTEGVLTKNDNDYLINIKSQNEIEDPFSVDISKPESLLKFLTDADFESDSILNYKLVQFIYSKDASANSEQYQGKKDLVLKKLSSHTFAALDFINRYSFTDSISDGLLADLCKRDEDLWDAFQKEDFFSNESRYNLFENILRYASVDSIVALDCNKNVSDYLSSLDYSVVFQNVAVEKTKSILLGLKPVFIELYNDSKEGNLIDIIYQNNLFDLNIANIKIILSVYSDSNMELVDYGTYSAIMESGCQRLIEIVNDEIDYFASNVLCKNTLNTKESEVRLIELLNNAKVPFECKKHLINISETKIGDVSAIADADVVEVLFESDCPKVSETNIKQYLLKLNLDDTDKRLINYLNRNSDDFCRLIKSMDKTFEEPSIVCGLFRSNNTSIEIYKALLANPVFEDEYPILDFSDIEETRVQLAIEAKIISLEPSTYQMADEMNYQLGTSLLESDVAYVENHFDEFDFSISRLIWILDKERFQKVHNSVVNKISIDDITTEQIAKSILNWLAKGENVISKEQFDKALELVEKQSDCKAYLTIAIRKGIINEPDGFVTDYLKYFDGDYKLMAQPRRSFDVNNTDVDKELVFALRDELHLLRRVDIHEKSIKCQTRYFK